MIGPERRVAERVASSTSGGAGGLVALVTLMLATMLANIASVALFPQIVTLSQEFGRPVNEVVWTLAAFHLVATGVGGAAAALGGSLGNRRMLVVTLGLLLAGSLVAALSTSLTVLIGGRVIQGVAMANQALAIGIVAAHWRGEARRRAMSMIVLAMGLGAVVAYLLSGLIWRGGGDWRTLFWILAGGSALTLALTLFFISETGRVRGVRIDYMGCIGLVTWSFLLLLPVSQANAWGWGSTKVLALMLPGLGLLILWVWWELFGSAAPLIDLRVLKRMGVWQGGAIWVVMAMAICVSAAASPYLFETPTSTGFGFGQSIFVVSLALMYTSVVMAAASAGATPLMRRIGARRTMVIGMLFGLGGFGLAIAHGSPAIVLMWLALLGFMPALAGSATYVVAAEAVRPEQGIQVSTIYTTAGGIGATVASALAGYLLTLRTVGVPVSTPDGPEIHFFPAEQTFTWAALLIGVAALVGIGCALSLRSSHQEESAGESMPSVSPESDEAPA